MLLTLGGFRHLIQNDQHRVLVIVVVLSNQ